MKNLEVILILFLAFSVGCDPAARSARVRPDKTINIQSINSNESNAADVYLSKDKKIEFQIYRSGPTTGAGTPSIDAIIVNNRSEPIQIDLSLATYLAD